MIIMKKLSLIALLISVIALALVSCEPNKEQEPEIEMVELDPSQLVGTWESTDTTWNSGDVRTSCSFFENGRFETVYLYGFMVECYWKMDGEGIHIFVNDEPLVTLVPVRYDSNVITLKVAEQVEGVWYYNRYYDIVLKKIDRAEYAPGYGTVAAGEYFNSRQRVEEFKQAMEAEMAGFSKALEELKTIHIMLASWQDIAQIETLWYTSYSVMIRANQAIDALTEGGFFPDLLAEFKYMRAWSSYVRVVCWGRVVPYWEHSSKDVSVYPRDEDPNTIMTCALNDLSSSGTSKADALRRDINSLIATRFSNQTLKGWGIHLPDEMSSFSDFLPVPMCILATNMNQVQNAGW